MSDEIRRLIGHSLKGEFEAFQEALDQCPERLLSQSPASGHSVAWHALHIMDWTRCMIQPGLLGVNPALRYGHLGFETEAWARAVTGPTLAHEQGNADEIKVAVRITFEVALETIWHAPQERFAAEAMWTTLKRPRPVVDGLLYHLIHTAYHRGQIRQVVNELATNSSQYAKLPV